MSDIKVKKEYTLTRRVEAGDHVYEITVTSPFGEHSEGVSLFVNDLGGSGFRQAISLYGEAKDVETVLATILSCVQELRYATKGGDKNE